jgi:hypothetical protein
MIEEKKLEQMADEQGMLEFFSEKHKMDLELAKMRMFHGFHKYCEELQEAYKNKTKDMTPEEKKEYEIDLDGGEDDDEWQDICSSLISKVQNEYHNSFDIEHEDMDITVSEYTSYFYIVLHATVYDSDKKLSELEFEVELNDKAHFLIDLINKLILES